MAETIQTKRCSKCKDFKQLSEFYKDSTRPDGYEYWCKNCKNACTKRYYQKHKTALIAYQKCYNKDYRQTPEGKVAQRRASKNTRFRHPERWKARNAMTYAITIGKLPRPITKLCYYCHKPAQQYHHWHGYEPKHWLDVVPVCQKCHTKKA